MDCNTFGHAKKGLKKIKEEKNTTITLIAFGDFLWQACFRALQKGIFKLFDMSERGPVKVNELQRAKHYTKIERKPS